MLSYRPIDEVIDFITSFPKPEEVLAYQAPASVQEKVENLLYKKQTSKINEEELNKYLLVNHIIIVAKKELKNHLLDESPCSKIN